MPDAEQDKANVVEAILRGEKQCVRCRRFLPAQQLGTPYSLRPDVFVCVGCWDWVMTPGNSLIEL